METKPFNMQSPEQIAKDYGGNKQKIAEAMQMGILDPTAGTLAGMFIDRMRSAAQQEAVPQQTVAQQVFSPAPPPEAPAAPPAGLGATPEAAAMPPMDAAPQMGPPPQEMALPPQEMAPPQMEMPAEEMPMMAEGGMVPPYMAGGGLSDVPIPDGMFDEPSNGGFGDGYAGGGMVAFGTGGDVDPTDWMRSPVTSKYGVKRSTGAHQGVDFGVGNKTPIGVPAPGKVIKAATDNINGNFVIVEHPDGTRSSYSHLAEFNVTPGQEVGTGEIIGLSGNTGRVRGKNGGHHLHFGARDAEGNRIDPMEFFKSIAPQVASGRFKNSKELAGAAQKSNTLYGMPTNLQDTISMLSGMMPEESEEQREYSESLKEQLSPESRAQAKKDAFFEGLGKLGARLAGAKDKSLLGGLAETLGAGAADIAESLDEDKKRIRDMQRELTAISNLNRREKMEIMSMGVDLNTKTANLAEGIATREADVAYKNAALAIQTAEVNNQLAKIIADSQGKENTKERFIETFYNKLRRSGYSENAARQWAYIIAEKKLAEIKGTGEELFGDEETGGNTGQKSADVYDYEKDLK